MPAYGKNLTPAEVTALVAFMQTLRPANDAAGPDSHRRQPLPGADERIPHRDDDLAPGVAARSVDRDSASDRARALPPGLGAPCGAGGTGGSLCGTRWPSSAPGSTIFVALASPIDDWPAAAASPHDPASPAHDGGAAADLAQPAPAPMLRGLPRPIAMVIVRSGRLGVASAGLGRLVGHPVVTWSVFMACLWAWHTPALFELALRSHAWHHVEHACFFGAGLLFWWPVIQPWPSHPVWPRWTMIPYLVLADLQNTALAAILTFADRVIYPDLRRGASALGDLGPRGSSDGRRDHVDPGLDRLPHSTRLVGRPASSRRASPSIGRVASWCPARTPEQQRLDEIHAAGTPWRQWGTYLSERQWGTVREDYSADGNAWDYLPHDHARSRAYRWGEDGIGGFSDDRQLMCLSVALWNGKDPILKERLFGLTNAQGNHGEDVKELYYYLDATPTCSYARMLYKYPQAAYPYQRLVDENARRGRHDPEFELIDTGLFDERPLLRRRDRVRQGRRRRRAAADHRPQPRTGGGRRSTCCLRCGSATPGAGPGTPRSPRSPPTVPASSSRHTRSWAPTTSTSRAERRSSSATTRPTSAGSSACGARRDSSRTPSTTTWSTGGRRRSTRRGRGTKAGGLYVLDVRPGAAPSSACDLRAGRHNADALRRLRRGGRRRADRRPTASTARCSRASRTRRRGVSSARRWPACSGASSSTATTSRGGSTATRPSRRRRPRASTAATATGATSTAPTILIDARQLGVSVVRGLGSRLPLRHRSPSSIPHSRRRSSSCSGASGTCTPTASSPPTSGTSAT